MTDFLINESSFEELLEKATDATLRLAGDEVAARARARAPRESGAGADSIAAHIREDGDDVVIDVGWSPEHYYMSFHEFGTEHLPARPFLRPALDHQ